MVIMLVDIDSKKVGPHKLNIPKGTNLHVCGKATIHFTIMAAGLGMRKMKEVLS